MTQKIPCPECGELNYESSPACWKCSAPLKAKPTAPQPPEPVQPPPIAAPEPDPPIAAVPVVPPDPPQIAAAPSPQPPTLPDQPSAPVSPSAPKPAELEAASLKEKDFVTPPVDLEEKPTSPGEWLAYGWAAITSAPSVFRESLDDYDSRRGRKSGGVSSYGCVLTILVVTVVAVLGVAIVSYMARNYAR